MLACDDARLLLSYGAVPGTPRKGVPELGFHLAMCDACSAIWIEKSSSTALSDNNAARPTVVAGEAYDKPDVNPLLSPPDNSILSFHDAAHLEHQAKANDEAEARLVLPVPISPSHPHAESPEHEGFTSPTAAEQQPTVPKRGQVTYRSLLQNPNFRLLWLGQSLSTFGSFFTQIAIPIYVLNVTGSYTQLGFAYFSSVVASLLVSLFAGALVDRWDRRRVMIAADFASGCTLVALTCIAILPLPLTVKLTAVYLSSFLVAILREVYKPARIAIFADVLHEEELLAANSLDSATTTFAQFISYPIAAAAIFYIGPVIAFSVDAATFYLSALLILMVRLQVRVTSKAAGSTLLKEIAEGLKAVRALPVVRKIVFLSLFVPLFISVFNTLQLPYAVDVLRSSSSVGFPALEAAMALGVVIGMILLGRWGQHVSRPMLLAVGIAGYGSAICGQGLVPYGIALLGWTIPTNGTWTFALFAALPFAFTSGAASSMVVTCIRTTIQEQTPRAMLGRVYGVVTMVAGIGFAAGPLLTGLAQGRVALMLAVLGAVVAAIGLACVWWLPERQTSTILLEPSFELQ